MNDTENKEVITQPVESETAPSVTPTANQVDYNAKLNELSQNLINQNQIIKNQHQENKTIKEENEALTKMLNENNAKIDTLQKQIQELLSKQPTQVVEQNSNPVVNDSRVDTLMKEFEEFKKSNQLRETQEQLAPVLETLQNEYKLNNEQIDLFIEKTTKDYGIDWTFNTSANVKKQLVQTLMPTIFNTTPTQNVGSLGGADRTMVNPNTQFVAQKTQQDLDRQKIKLQNQTARFESLFGTRLK